jgi:hypothetical protein
VTLPLHQAIIPREQGDGMQALCRLADGIKGAVRWLQDAASVAVIVAAAIGLLAAILRAIQVAVP